MPPGTPAPVNSVTATTSEEQIRLTPDVMLRKRDQFQDETK